MSETKQAPKFRYGHTFIIGLAFFSSEIAWAVYNSRVPLLLNNYLASFGLIGLMMALDNIIGVIIQPIMGSVSDRTRTRFGRRMPYLMIGVPLGALFFALIPTQTSFWELTIWIICFGTAMGFYRSQAVSLMPDFVRPVNRSKGNAIINFMGGIGVAFGYGANLFLYIMGLQVLFVIVSIIMVIALIILVLVIKEKESFSYQLILEAEAEGVGKTEADRKEQKTSLIKSVKMAAKEEDKSLVFMLLAIFFWFIGYQGIVALISIYGVQVLGYDEALAGFLPFLVTVPLLISIIPLSFLATKIGRKRTIKIGVTLWIISLITGFFMGLLLVPLYIIAIPLVFLGLGWAMINTNSIVIVWELAPSEKEIGTYTGLYYFSSYLAAILGPMIIGFLTDLFTLPSLLMNGAIFFGLALVMMMFVRRGEPEFTPEEKLARQKAIQEMRE